MAQVEQQEKQLKALKMSPSSKKMSGSLDVVAQHLFNAWKTNAKLLEELHQKQAHELDKNVKEKSVLQLDTDIQTLRDIAGKFSHVLLFTKEGMFVFKGNDKQFADLVKLGAKGGGKELKQGKVDDMKKVLREFRF